MSFERHDLDVSGTGVSPVCLWFDSHGRDTRATEKLERE